MKHTLMIAALVCSVSSVTLSQAQSVRNNSDEKPNGRQVLRSPSVNFKDQADVPLRLLLGDTYAVASSPRTVEVELEPRSEGGKAVRAYTVYCEEELANPTEGDDVVKKLHRINSKVLQTISFRVQKDSRLTFWVVSVEFDDGTVWRNAG
jgi:hypothetical protein